jgi:hypothetical protein
MQTSIYGPVSARHWAHTTTSDSPLALSRWTDSAVARVYRWLLGFGTRHGRCDRLGLFKLLMAQLCSNYTLQIKADLGEKMAGFEATLLHRYVDKKYSVR